MSCPDCVTGGLLPGVPTGVTSTQGAYFAAAPGGSPSKRAILLLTDVFGLALVNPKLIADDIAKRLNCDVWIPDYFNGIPIIDPRKIKIPAGPPGSTRLWLEWLRLIMLILPRLTNFFKNRPPLIDGRLDKFMAAIQEEKKYEKVGAFGYCFGGSATIRMAGTNHIQSAVICHPGGFSLDQTKAIKVPVSWVCAEEDMHFKDSFRLQVEAVFAGRKDTPEFVPYEFVVYKGTTHGFACRPDFSNAQIKEAYEKSLEQIANWFEKTLPVS
ncbi:hypothetical protein AMATHDRAFT_63701 [Amanita thiersii Skay4041]|uniref:Dienelactone hydrolase domain-containing protein n=1 Tax=Amanita thiersii Skay4041 TaxID=703135 RepID=A0A2A9NN82_9AGAR|nr:hypothetical protein AMATHDRAFT_63701 [Amanita thiersii Skay4041]